MFDKFMNRHIGVTNSDDLNEMLKVLDYKIVIVPREGHRCGVCRGAYLAGYPRINPFEETSCIA